MDRETAEAIVFEYRSFGDILNRLTQISMKIPNNSDARRIREAAIGAQSALHEGLIRNLVTKQYPDLDPDGTASSN